VSFEDFFLKEEALWFWYFWRYYIIYVSNSSVNITKKSRNPNIFILTLFHDSEIHKLCPDRIIFMTLCISLTLWQLEY